MAGRKSKLSKVQKDLIAALKTGATDRDVCAHVGIHPDTFYDWLRRGETGEAEYSEFSDAVTRARVTAKANAIETLATAMHPHKGVSRAVKTYTETRLRKVVDPESGEVVEEPYEYKETTVTETTTWFQGDWRASVEYLKRRHKSEWGDNVDLTSDGKPLAAPTIYLPEVADDADSG